MKEAMKAIEKIDKNKRLFSVRLLKLITTSRQTNQEKRKHKLSVSGKRQVISIRILQLLKGEKVIL